MAAVPDAERIAMAPDLLAELSEKDEGAAELLAVVAMPPDDLDPDPRRARTCSASCSTARRSRATSARSSARPTRSGRTASSRPGTRPTPTTPRSVRASTGSFFAVPVVRSAGHADVMAWVASAERASGTPVVVVATDEDGDADVSGFDLRQPVLLLVGNETSGLSQAWREAADVTVSIPMTGSASSLNAANAATVVLYEARRQRSG